jgi:hypothetical protein
LPASSRQSFCGWSRFGKSIPAPGPLPFARVTPPQLSKYFVNSDIKSRKIDVDTKNGVVTLNGAVGTPAARDMAMNLARETDGVTKVMNNLKIDPSLK